MKGFFSRVRIWAGIAVTLGIVSPLWGEAPEVGVFAFDRPGLEQRIEVYFVKSANYEKEDPPVMVFHGMRRNADVYRDGWIELAKEHDLYVVVPEFTEEDYPGTNGYNLGNVFRSEEDLTRRPRTGWSYLIPDEVYDHLRYDRKETVAKGYSAFGHSAGSQFLHRKIAFVPDDRLLLAVAANAGWYTFPNDEDRWPYGFGGTGYSNADLKALLASNLVVLLGDQDIDPMHRSLRRTVEAMRQGKHRFERGHSFHAAGAELSEKMDTPFSWKIQIVPGVAHEGSKMAPAAARLMVAFVEELKDGKDEGR